MKLCFVNLVAHLILNTCMGSITTHTSSYYDIRCAYYIANLSYISIKSIYFYPLYVCLPVYISCVNIVLFRMFVIVLCTEQ